MAGRPSAVGAPGGAADGSPARLGGAAAAAAVQATAAAREARRRAASLLQRHGIAEPPFAEGGGGRSHLPSSTARTPKALSKNPTDGVSHPPCPLGARPQRPIHVGEGPPQEFRVAFGRSLLVQSQVTIPQHLADPLQILLHLRPALAHYRKKCPRTGNVGDRRCRAQAARPHPPVRREAGRLNALLVDALTTPQGPPPSHRQRPQPRRHEVLGGPDRGAPRGHRACSPRRPRRAPSSALDTTEGPVAPPSCRWCP